jgi:hypothetical protein
MRKTILTVVLALLPFAASAQESKFHAELRTEGENIKESCSAFTLKQIGSCAITLATDHPLHVAFGSIAPQNGMAFGGALVTHRTPNEYWRLGWDSDVVGAPGGAWRAGTYFRAVRTAVAVPQVVTGTASPTRISIHPYPVFSAYAQTITLPAVTYYGLGPSTDRQAKTEYGMRQGIVGGGVNYPVTAVSLASWGLSLLGEVNARFADLRNGTSDEVPSIETVFSDATAPGLESQPAFFQLGEGVRFAPALVNNHLQLNYRFQWQQYFAGSSSHNTFQRWTLDLGHEVPIYRTSMPGGGRVTNGPNECFAGPAVDQCPPVSHDRWGTVSVRLLVSKSLVSDTDVVPFYFQRTLGGSDINGNRALPSYDDYRFRGPHVLLIQESLEHAIVGPVGVLVGADQGKVALQDESLNFKDLRHSFIVGATVRAAGFPAVMLTYATGGPEGHHVAFTINTSLLGGSSRLSLY